MSSGCDGKLDRFADETDALRRNRMLFDWLCDGDQRAALYAELQRAGFPVLRFKSVARVGGDEAWPSEDVYLVTSARNVAAALQRDSVAPYAHLDSGGRFMLGLDDGPEHSAQRAAALGALCFQAPEIQAFVDRALDRALVLPLKNHQFDLVDVAERVAIHFAALLFGLSTKSHVHLTLAMRAAYLRLVFEIIGRHFVSDSGLPPAGTDEAQKGKRELEKFIRDAAGGPEDEGLDRTGLPDDSVIARLYRHYGPAAEEPVFVALGLMAGTVGNVKAAVAIAIDRFFELEDDSGQPLIESARLAARSPDPDRLEAMIKTVLGGQPPAAFLARESRDDGAVMFKDEAGRSKPVPPGSRLLLAMGAEARLMFGGGLDDAAFVHSCVGQRLAWPLIATTIRRVLVLPGLSRVFDAGTGEPIRLKTRWGAMADSFALQFQRDRRLNQQPLYVVLPIKPPIAENAKKLALLTAAGAHVVEQALRNSGHVHFAWFSIVENGTHLALSTVYDGDFDAYVEHFALKVPLFDEQFQYLEDAPRTPIKDYPKDFVDTIRKYNRKPLADYFFSAYPLTSVADIDNAGLGSP